MLIYELFRSQTEGMGFLGEKDVEEAAANAAQRAAIAIAMKKDGKKPKKKNESTEPARAPSR
jgi:hypothetical protein